MSWIQLMNALFEAHRNKDIVTKHIILAELAKVEPEYADTLDAYNY